MAVAALVVYLVFIAAGLGWKSYRQWRATGSTGVRGFHGRPGSREWFAGVGFIAAIIAAFCSAGAITSTSSAVWLALHAVTPAILPTLSQIALSQPSQCMPFTDSRKFTGAESFCSAGAARSQPTIAIGASVIRVAATATTTTEFMWAERMA